MHSQNIRFELGLEVSTMERLSLADVSVFLVGKWGYVIICQIEIFLPLRFLVEANLKC